MLPGMIPFDSTDSEHSCSNLIDITDSDEGIEDHLPESDEWSSNAVTFVERNIPFTGPCPGPCFPDINPLQIVKRFLTDEIVDMIVVETNTHSFNERKHARRSRDESTDLRKTPCTRDEFWRFLAVLLLVEIHGKPDIDSNWSRNWLLHTPAFSHIMPLDRFRGLLSGLHFADDSESDPNDKLWKIRRLFELLRQRLSVAYNMDRRISVDESMALWKGNHTLKRYIPKKASAWGFKFYALAESTTGYIANFLVDEGSRTRIPSDASADLQKPGKIVMALMQPFLDRGHFLAMDNFYTDLVLFEALVSNNTHCIGTVRKNRRFLPKDIINRKWRKAERGVIVASYRTNLFISCWYDKRPVRILSSVGNVSISENKPLVVRLYNEAMPGVDLADQKRHSRTISLKQLSRWYRRIFFHLIDIILVNSYCIGQHVPDIMGLTHTKFRLALIDQIVRVYDVASGSSHVSPHLTGRLIQRHSNLQKAEKARRCVVCTSSGIRTQTKYFCADCDVALCPSPCFHIHHDTPNIVE